MAVVQCYWSAAAVYYMEADESKLLLSNVINDQFLVHSPVSCPNTTYHRKNIYVIDMGRWSISKKAVKVIFAFKVLFVGGKQ